jgi:hypothetical protein
MLLAAVGISAAVSAAEYQITPDAIRSHIEILAHDSLEGRQIGEPGETKAAQYLSDVFSQAGLEPRGDSGFLQPFEFVKSVSADEGNSLTVNGTVLEPEADYYPLRQSGDGPFSFTEIISVGYGITVDSADGDYDDYLGLDVAGKAVLILRRETDDSTFSGIDFRKYDFISSKITNALKHGVAGILFATPEHYEETPLHAGMARVSRKEIPILFLKRPTLERLQVDLGNPALDSVVGEVLLLAENDTGYNVAAYLPGACDTTVIIGAHFDHLGWGTETSLYRGEEPMIHNGADDNGSGTAVMLELARQFASTRDDLHYSMLFVGFSGEEAGILGSSHFASNLPVDSAKVRMMINLDMIGRLSEQEGLIVFGTGTAKEFGPYLDTLSTGPVKLIPKEAGIGASDHTPFYNHNIPVLFFFTGAHGDYHRPSDDAEKIDFDGTAEIAHLVGRIITDFDNAPGPLIYQRTASQERPNRRYKVTLGFIPDFAAEVTGVKVANTSPDRPAERAGIKAGDVIIALGDQTLGDLYEYMGALGKFSRGDSTVVTFVRGTDTLKVDLVFE